MPPKNTEKKLDSIKELQKNISQILVINNSSLKPYIELFEYAPENIYQQPLGNLIGFFEIKEYSEDSAYVVNFLTSVLKKEYYANPRRSVAESFDSAMNKVNLALSEVAKHGNVEWIGKLHACICVIEKNSIHFTVAGNAKIFLNRKKVLTEISEGLSSDESQPHPLKTFINVSSGRLEKEDKLIITCEDIFHILKLSELKKSLQRLTKPQFVQFLKTALSNELEMIATIIADFEEVKKAPATKNIFLEDDEFLPEAINVFSQAAFPKKNPASAQKIEKSNQELEQVAAIEYTDKKTGHIYVQGGAPPEEISQAQHYWEQAVEKISDGWLFTKNSLARKYKFHKKQLGKKIQQAKINAQLQKQERLRQQELEKERLLEQQLQTEFLEKQKASELEVQTLARIAPEQSPISSAPKKRLTEIINLKEKLTSSEKFPNENSIKANKKNSSYQPKAIDSKVEVAENQSSNLNLGVTSYYSETDNNLEAQRGQALFEKLKPILQKVCALVPSGPNYIKNIKKNLSQKVANVAEKTKSTKINLKDSQIIPHLSKLKKIYQSLSSKQKLTIFLAILVIFIAPIFINIWLNKPKPVTIKDLPAEPSISQISKLTTEKNINFNTETTNLIANINLSKVILADKNIVTLTKEKIIILKNGQQFDYPLPSDASSVLSSAYMPSLSMLLILTDQGKLLSFTITNSKFSENKINLPTLSTNSLIGTYLTYLYVLDPASNQIARFPRADGGFGEKINWLKDITALTGISDLTIDDSVYVIQNNQIIKFLKGKRENFTLETSATPVHFDKIFTTIDLKSLYALDVQNSRLVQYDKATGAITAQFYNEALKNSTSLAVDEKNKTAYVVTSSGLISMAIQ